jgi:hypothetical protein
VRKYEEMKNYNTINGIISKRYGEAEIRMEYKN